MKEKIIANLNNVKRRPGMYVQGGGYLALSSYILGYFSGIESATGTDYLEGINPWMSERFGQKSSCHWTAYIELLLAKEDEEQAKVIIFDVVFEYLDIKFKD
jgi:hypothetical protein